MADELVRVAVVVLVRDGRVLLGRRHPGRRWYPGCWDLVGGHVEPGEAPEDAACRECREEVGVDVRHLRPITLASGIPSLEVHAFVATAWDGEPANTAPDEHDDLRWFAPDELAHLDVADPPMIPDVVAAVRAAHR